MSKLTIITSFLVFACLPVNAQNDINLNDGPYVFYTKDSIIVKSVQYNNSFRRVIEKAYPISQKNNIQLSIKFAGDNNYSFKVNLQSTLVNEPWTFSAPSKILALSDIEGEFEALRLLLIANKVMDKKFNWIFGSGHLIICGDLFDRGTNVTEQLWLLYKLEQDAKLKGGYLHTLLGNHDIMNLSNDVRYVQPKYFESAIALGTSYDKLYAQNTELGRWLRTKNIVEKIGDYLCLHAGISAEVNALQVTVEEMNKLARPYFDKSEDGNLLKEKHLIPFFSGSSAPFWYRGYFFEPMATLAQIDSTLRFYDVKTIMVGHTITDTNIGSYFNNKVIGLDVDQHNKRNEAVLIENGQAYVVNANGQKAKIKKY